MENEGENEAKKTYLSILNSERQNGLDNKLLEDSILNFNRRLENIDWYNYYKTKPFLESSLSLYKWSPIADELKQLDKEIVLNSIKLKWNIVENEFKELVKELKFN